MGDEIVLDKSAWNQMKALRQLRVLSHEATHSAQYARLGKGPFLLRRLKETFQHGTYGQYNVTAPLDTARLSEIDIVDQRFTLEATAVRVSDFVGTPGILR